MKDASATNHYDVAILGGGLAGGCLARQLRQEAPDAARAGRREAAASGSRSGVQGRRVERRNRRALFSEEPRPRAAPARARSSKSSGCAISSPTATIATSRQRVELGPSEFPPVPSFQLDRGRLENILLRDNAELGATVLDGWRVRIDRARRGRTASCVAIRAGRITPNHGALGRRCQRPRRAC